MARLALIDGDVVVYKAAWACEKPMDWGDGVHTLTASEADIIRAVDMIVSNIERVVQPDDRTFYLSASTNFRHNVYPAYKSNRKENRKPIAWKAARTYLEEHFPTFTKSGLEADDCMGIVQTSKADTVICSIDKDMLQIPGLHYNWGHEEDGVFTVSEVDADLVFWRQILSGDPVDGYAGIPGCGPKTAEKIIAKATERGRWPAVVAAYAKAGLTEEYALQMARCARILRACDYDTEKQEVKLWTPS